MAKMMLTKGMTWALTDEDDEVEGAFEGEGELRRVDQRNGEPREGAIGGEGRVIDDEDASRRRV